MPQRTWRVAVCALLAALLAAPALADRPAVAQEADPALDVVPGRYIVVLREPAPDARSGVSAAAAISSLDAVPGVEVDQRYTTVFDGFAAEIDPAAARRLARDPSVAAVYPDLVQSAFAQTTPTSVDRIDADKHPTRAGDGGGAVDADIAILDTGVAPHDDLTVAGGVNCIPGGGASYADDNFHGTFVAGLAAAEDNGVGIVGAAPGARVWSVKVLDRTGDGNVSWILCGLDWVAARSGTIEVANLSFGGYYPYNSSCSGDPYHAAFCELYARGVTVVSAGGNGASNSSNYVPAAYEQVISVSALADRDGRPGGLGGSTSAGPDDSLATFSNYGAVIDIAAPGVDVVSLANARSGTAGGRGMAGTSYATPLVAGGAALVMLAKPADSPASVKKRLLEAAQPGPIPGDRDGAAEPILSVGFLGRGLVTSVPSARPGDVAPVEVSNFAAGSRISLKFDGDTLATLVADANGKATYKMKVPFVTRGAYLLEATNLRKRDTASFAVVPRLSLSTRAGVADASVGVSLRGFAAGESILLTFDTGASVRSLVRVRASSSGSATGSFAVPSSTAGDHRLAAVGDRGTEVSTTFTTRPSIRARMLTATTVDVQLRGFDAAEAVAVRWDAPAATLATTRTLATGSKGLTVTVPRGSDGGTHRITADGAVHDLSTTVSQTRAADVREPTPRSTRTATPTPAATGTPAETPSQSPTEPPVEVPTDTPAEVPPTETAVPSTETPTETPTEVPPTATATATAVPPTETPTEVSPAEPPAEPEAP